MNEYRSSFRWAVAWSCTFAFSTLVLGTTNKLWLIPGTVVALIMSILHLVTWSSNKEKQKGR